jgi:hypothetical protein
LIFSGNSTRRRLKENTMKSIYILVSSLALGFLLVACGGSKSEPAPAPSQAGIDFPDWVNKGSGAFSGDGKKAFYGVGMASGIKNQPLAMSTADNRARAEISKVFEVYSASLMKDYMASTTAGDMTASSEEQHVEQAIKTFSANTLSGVVIANHWFHPDGTIYSLAKLDLDSMKNLAGEAKELSPKVRDYVRKNAEKSFDSLDKEESKRAGTPAAENP